MDGFCYSGFDGNKAKVIMFNLHQTLAVRA